MAETNGAFPAYIVRPEETGVLYGGGGGMSNTGRGMLDAMEGGKSRLIFVCGMADEGGSTGRLARQFGTQAMGDLRRNLAVTADGDNSPLRQQVEVTFNDRLPRAANWEDYLAARAELACALQDARSGTNVKLIQRALREMDEVAQRVEGGLGRHSLGNLMLTAFARHSGTLGAIDAVSELLASRATVLPTTLDPHRLWLQDGAHAGARVLEGEHVIDEYTPQFPHDTIFKITGNPQMYGPSYDALAKNAYAIGMPGSWLTTRAAIERLPGFLDAIAELRADGGFSASVFNLTRGKYDPKGWCSADFIGDTFRLTGHMPDAVVRDDGTRPLPPGEERLPYRQERVEALGAYAIAAPLVGGAARQDPNSDIDRSGVIHDGKQVLLALRNGLAGIYAHQRQVYMIGMVS